MFENFKKLLTPRNYKIFATIIGVIVVVIILKSYGLYEGFREGVDPVSTPVVPSPVVPSVIPSPVVPSPVVPSAIVAPPTAVVAPPTAIVAPPTAVVPPPVATKGPSTNDALIQ